jgi:hypothetical protein
MFGSKVKDFEEINRVDEKPDGYKLLQTKRTRVENSRKRDAHKINWSFACRGPKYLHYSK